MPKNLVILPGDGYELSNQKKLIDYLSSKGFNVKWIQLMESDSQQLSYDDLLPENYCKYISSKIPPEFDSFYMYGISKGCYWSQVYASLNPHKVQKLLLIEPTTMKPDLLKNFELNRNNDFIQEYYDNPAHVTREDNSKTALDVLVSETRRFIPKCPTTIIWTSRDNRNEPYTPEVISLKKKFEAYLKNNGCKLKVLHVDGSHTLDQEEANYPLIYRALIN